MGVPNKSDNSDVSAAFRSVAAITMIDGIKIRFKLKEPLNLPVIKPVQALVKALRPMGAAERKSKRRPDIKPQVLPAIDEFIKDMYTTTIKTRSGITGKKKRLVITVAVTSDKKRQVSVDHRIILPITPGLPGIHRVRKHFPNEKNQ